MDPDNNNPQTQPPLDDNPGAQPSAPPQPGQSFSPNAQPPQAPLEPGQPGAPASPDPFASQSGTPLGQPGAPSNAGTKRRLVVVLLIVLVAAVLGVAAYFAFFRDNDSDDSAQRAASQSSSSSNADAIDLATLQTISMSLANPPEDYVSTDEESSPTRRYTYQGADGKETCELAFGVLTSEQLPGDNLDAIVQPQINQLREAGATIDGPSAGTALILKDATDSDITYRVPTLDFKFSFEGNNATVYYSAVILKSGERAVVNRACSVRDGQVNEDRLKTINERANQIVITKE